MNRKYLFTLILGIILPCLSAQASDQGNQVELKLREALRNVTIQLRNVQTENNTLKTEKAQSDFEKEELKTKLDTLTKEMNAERETAEKTISELTVKSSNQEAEITRLSESLAKWKAAYDKAAGIAKEKENERAKLAEQKILLERQTADFRAKNLELYEVANEILTRYKRFGLGTAIAAREPFTGITKVKLQTLVQDYQDKLTDQKIKQ